MQEFNYRNRWYKVGDYITIGGYFSRQWFGSKWEVIHINSNSSAIVERAGKTKTIIGSVRGFKSPNTNAKPEDFNQWMKYIYTINYR